MGLSQPDAPQSADGAGVRTGYYQPRSHKLLPVEKCPISSPLINRAMAAVWARGRAGEIPAAVRELEFFADHADETLLIEAYCEPRTSQQDAEAAAEER